MASKEALCRIRIKCSISSNDGTYGTKEPTFEQPDRDINSISTPHCVPLCALGDCPGIPVEMRLQWAKAIAGKFCDCTGSDHYYGIHDWDLVLSLDGSVENIADNLPTSSTSTSLSTAEKQLKVYPARYRLPRPIIDRLSSGSERTSRAELFALGSLLYELISYKKPFHDLGDDEKDDEEIQTRYAKGEFPNDVWGLPMAVVILGCWCPEFAKELASPTNGSLLNRTGNYIKNHPILFSLQVLGGVASIGSLAVVPVLGAVGFAATGPIAGSAAAGWQASIGLVQAGSLFAWCQSAAMGGAAVSGIVATGFAGAGVGASASVAGALAAVSDGGAVPGSIDFGFMNNT